MPELFLLPALPMFDILSEMEVNMSVTVGAPGSKEE